VTLEYLNAKRHGAREECRTSRQRNPHAGRAKLLAKVIGKPAVCSDSCEVSEDVFGRGQEPVLLFDDRNEPWGKIGFVAREIAIERINSPGAPGIYVRVRHVASCDNGWPTGHRPIELGSEVELAC
jgi:hypothetical protein